MDQGKTPSILTKNFLSIFLIDVLFATSFGLIATIIPLWLFDRFKTDSETIGLILGLSGLGTLVIRPFMGFAIDRWGRRNIHRISLCSFAILNISFLFAQNLWAVCIIRFLQCIPFAAITTCNVTIATDSIPDERRGEGFSYFTAAATLPMAIGPAVGIALYERYWYWPFIVAGLIGIFCFIFSFFINVPYYKPQYKKLSVKSLFNKKLLFITLTGAFCMSVLPGLLGFLTLYIEEIGLNLDLVGIILFCYAISLFIVRVFGAKILNRLDPKYSGGLAIILFGVGILIIGISHVVLGIGAGAMIMGIGSGILLPTMLMMAAKIAPENRGISNSMVFVGVDIAQSIGSYGFGLIAKLTGAYASSYITFSGIEIIGLIVFLMLAIPHYEMDRQKLLGILSADT